MWTIPSAESSGKQFTVTYLMQIRATISNGIHDLLGRKSSSCYRHTWIWFFCQQPHQTLWNSLIGSAALNGNPSTWSRQIIGQSLCHIIFGRIWSFIRWCRGRAVSSTKVTRKPPKLFAQGMLNKKVLRKRNRRVLQDGDPAIWLGRRKETRITGCPLFVF